MEKNIVIIHYNTPRLTNCLVRSINKFVSDAKIYIFDNSDKYPFRYNYNNVKILDNTHGQIIDFGKWLSGYPNRIMSAGRANNFASAKHAYSVEVCMGLIKCDGFLLIDSDVLIKRDISSLFADDCIYAGEVITQPDGKIKRICPYLCFINTKLCKENDVHFFDDSKMHGLCKTVDSDMFDTGAAFYYSSIGLECHSIKTSDWCEHYGHGSWVKTGHRYNMSHEEWLFKNRYLWLTDETKDVVVSNKLKYVTVSDLSDTIRKNIWKIPRDIDFVIGVPRSGMFAAGLISSFLNVPLIDVNSFIAGVEPSGGNRLRYFNDSHIKTGRAIVVDDTVNAGTAMNNTRNRLLSLNRPGIDFIYMCVYLEGWGEDVVDFYLEDLRMYTSNFTRIVAYEWNIFQHNEKHMSKCLYDMDGVLCVDPPDERNESEYLEYIKNAVPLFIPRAKIGGIMTYRLLKNKDITIKWLHENGVKYGQLLMFNANTWEERKKSGLSPEVYKGEYYKANPNYELFVESSDSQAKKIAQISGKPVYCVETNRLYQ